MNYKFSDNVTALKPSAIREILKFSSQPGMIPFSAGNPSVEAFPVNTVTEIVSDILHNDPISALQYSVTEGYDPLRNSVKKFLSDKFNIGNNDDSIIITSGAQQVMNLATKVLANRGDTIVSENPSFIGSLNSFRSYGINLLGIPMEKDGMDVETLNALLDTNKSVRFVYTIPNFQNPTGITMSLEKRKRLYEVCLSHGVIIIEDNPYGELRFGGKDVPSIKSFDSEGIVIYAGSFSKVLSPGLRVGFAIANNEVISKMTVCKQTDDVHTGILSQMIAHKFLTEYDYEAHLKNIRKIYKKKAELAMDCCDKMLGDKVSYYPVEGGLFMWCNLPEGSDMIGFCKKGIQNGVAVVPGTAFLIDDSEKTDSFRINFSTPSEEQIIKGFEIISEIL